MSTESRPDLVIRLRDVRQNRYVAREAADEIESLRRLLKDFIAETDAETVKRVLSRYPTNKSERKSTA